MTNKRRLFAKGVIRNAAVMLAIVMLLGMILTSCAGRVESFSVDPDKIAYEEGTNSLVKAELTKVATLVGSSAEAREKFTAAYRGYDMTAEDFDDDNLPEAAADEETKLAYAVRALEAAVGDSDVLKDVDFKTKMNFADVESIIGALKVEVNTESAESWLGKLLYFIGIGLLALTNTIGFGNYLIGICIFAIIVEILMIPFSIKQQKNSIKQAKLRPKEMAIRNKYKGRNDQATQQKVNQEIQALYQRENFSPASGCLPLLIQMPIILALYNIVVDPLRYVLGRAADLSSALSSYYTTARAAGGLGGDLTANARGTIEIVSKIKEEGMEAFEGLKDFLYFGGNSGERCFDSLNEIKDSIPNFNIGKLNFGLIPDIGSFNWLWAIPVITFVVYFLSMKLTRKLTYQPTTNGGDDKAVGCSNNIMDIGMPLFSAYISFIVPAAVGVYWVFKSILTTLKQLIMRKVMPLPEFSEEDYKAAEKEYNSKSPKNARPARSSGTGGEKPRSLHHIDDDDYDTTPKTPERKSEETAADGDAEPDQPESKKPRGKKAKGMIEAAPLKEDDRNSDGTDNAGTTGDNEAEADETAADTENKTEE